MISVHSMFEKMQEHLRTRRRMLEYFCKYEFQDEGWLKGELLGLLERMRIRGDVGSLDREVIAVGKKKIDLQVDLKGGRHWIELKHWLIGKQKGQNWYPTSYVTEFENEFYKFSALKASGRAWIVVLCTANPGADSWEIALNGFNREYAPWTVECLDRTEDYPAGFFLGVLKARGF